MPPRYAYWTILIDDKPTAFRAREQEELLPTIAQLRRTNPNVAMKWFARGKLWDSPEQAHWASKNLPRHDDRTRDWRPGGKHEDPRARFKKGGKKPNGGRPDRPRGDRPWQRETGPRRDGPGRQPRRHRREPGRRATRARSPM